MFLSADPKGEKFVYTCGKSVVTRNLANPLIAELYDDHQHDPTVAQYAPSGFYVASGDSHGIVRIWDTTQAEHMCKFEIRCLAGAVRDISWSADSKRVCVVGDGRETYGRVFMWDSGSSVGEIGNHTKPINSCSMRPDRPFRCVTASEDFSVNWFEGPPFKYKKKFTEHTRFVNCVRYDNAGTHFASAGSDKKIVLYEGKAGDKKSELNGHTGGVYCLSWNKDGSRLLSASADRSCKIWDIETGTAVTTFQFAKDTDHQQLGCLWSGDHLLSVNLAGTITYLDPNNADKPARVIRGHNKFATSVAASGGSLFSASYDAAVVRWDESTGENEAFTGDVHKNTIPTLRVQGDNLVSCAMDDSVRIASIAERKFTASIGTDSPVADVAVSKTDNDLRVAVTMNNIVVIRGTSKASETKVSYQPQCVALSTDNAEVAVGGDDNKLHIYSLAGDKVTETATIEDHRGVLSAAEYSGDGKYLAACDRNREIIVYDKATRARKINGWVFHTARVQSIAWSPDNVHVASCSQDGNVIVWNVDTPTKRLTLKPAHQMGVNKITWVDANTLATVGQDCTLKTWTVEY